MELDYLDENKDYIIGKKYYLCKAKVSELAKFVKAKYTGFDFTKFNEDAKPMPKFKKPSEEELQDEYKDDHYHFDKKPSFETWAKKHVKYLEEQHNDNVKGYKEDEGLENLIYETAVENNFITIYSAEPKIVEKIRSKQMLRPDGQFYLIDGFRRLLFDFNYVSKDNDREVYVKVYDKHTTDQDIMALLFHYNLWKISKGVDHWFDRGWRFFIYNRLGIHLDCGGDWRYTNKDKSKNHFQLLNDYLDDDDILESKELVTGPAFYDDLKTIDEFVKGGSFTTDLTVDGAMLTDLFSMLPKKRLDGEYQHFDINLLRQYIFVRVDEVNHMRAMESYGHMCNRMATFTREFMDIWMDGEKTKALWSQVPAKATKVPIQDFIAAIPEEIRKKYKIEGSHRLWVGGHAFRYHSNRKLTKDASGAIGDSIRVYAFVHPYMLYLWNGRTCVQEIGEVQYEWNRFRERADPNDKRVYAGAEPGAIETIKRLTGVDVKIDKKTTLFY